MTTWYIDPDNGNDANSGTSDSAPLKSYVKAGWTASLAAGDRVLQKSGTVYGSQISMTNWKNNILLSAYGFGPKPIIDPGGVDYSACISMVSSTVDLSGITIDGIDLRGATYYYSGSTAVGAGVRIALSNGRQVTNCKIRNCDIHDCFFGLRVDAKDQATTTKVTSGILFERNNVYSTRNAWISILGSTTASCYVRGITIRNNNFYDSGRSNGVLYLGSAHGISIQTRDVAGSVGNENVAMLDTMAIQDVVIEGNTFDTNLGYALFLKGVQSSVPGVKRNKIRRNTVKNFGWSNNLDTHGIWVGGCDDVLIERNSVSDGGVFVGQSYGSGVGIFVDRLSNVDGCKRVKVRRNHVARCGRGPTTAVDGGSGIYVYISQDVDVTANVVRECRTGVSVQGGGATFPTMNVRVLNNTLINNFVQSADGGYDGAAYGISVTSGSAACQNVAVKNNIVVGGKMGLYRQNVGVETLIDEGGNVFWDIGNAVEAGTIYGLGTATNRDNPASQGTLDASSRVANPCLVGIYPTDDSFAGVPIGDLYDFDGFPFKRSAPSCGAFQRRPVASISPLRA